MTAAETYFVVKLECFYFETREHADKFHDALLDAVCAMPEFEGYGSQSRVCEEIAEVLGEKGVG